MKTELINFLKVKLHFKTKRGKTVITSLNSDFRDKFNRQSYRVRNKISGDKIFHVFHIWSFFVLKSLETVCNNRMDLTTNMSMHPKLLEYMMHYLQVLERVLKTRKSNRSKE